MDRNEAYAAWFDSDECSGGVSPFEAFRAGWEAALREFVLTEADHAKDEHTPTLEGVTAYLESKDREAYGILRRESADLIRRGNDPARFRFIDDLQSYWIGYGEAWGYAQKAAGEPPQKVFYPGVGEGNTIVVIHQKPEPDGIWVDGAFRLASSL